jgi:hypothetical protein
MSSTAKTEQLAALVAAKQHVLEILVQLSKRQLEVIGTGDISLLMKVLSAKQTVMNQLQTIEGEMKPFRDENPEERVWRSAEDRTACQARAERCNALLAEALALEQQAEQAMVEKRDAAGATLAAVQTAADARFAYASNPIPSVATLQVEGLVL